MMDVLKNGLLLAVFFSSSFSVFGMETKRLIVKFKKGSLSKKANSNFMRPFKIEESGHEGNHMMIVHMKSRKGLLRVKKMYQKDDSVLYVEEDRVMSHFYEPGDGTSIRDQQYRSQWHYFESSGGVNLPAAWDLTRGLSETIIAVIDTGITRHSDLNDKVILGADLISDPLFSNDGDGRDQDPSDPGDWVQFGDSCYSGAGSKSTWHGTHIAGTIAASSGNGVGVAGVNWNAKILPVRVLGKCGGYESDIADGIRWAVGSLVSGLPLNQNPAKVINLSLGGVGDCGQTMQAAIDHANAKGAVVIVAAGNDNADLNSQSYSPANCKGVLAIAASNRNGGRAYYSNYGSKIDVTAPGGGRFGGILSTHNSGFYGPSSETYTSLSGTSMSAPHVSGIVSLMLALGPGLYPEQIREIIRNTAQGFTMGSSCNTFICGHGIVDAYQAVLSASMTTPDSDFEGNDPPPSEPSEGQTVFFRSSEDGGGGGCGTIHIDDKNSGGPGGALVYSIIFLVGAFLIRHSARGRLRAEEEFTKSD